MIIQVNNTVFVLNPDDRDEQGNLTELAPIHAQMLADFEDEEKLNYFKQLLEENPNTAFIKYNNL